MTKLNETQRREILEKLSEIDVMCESYLPENGRPRPNIEALTMAIRKMIYECDLKR